MAGAGHPEGQRSEEENGAGSQDGGGEEEAEDGKLMSSLCGNNSKHVT